MNFFIQFIFFNYSIFNSFFNFWICNTFNFRKHVRTHFATIRIQTLLQSRKNEFPQNALYGWRTKCFPRSFTKNGCWTLQMWLKKLSPQKIKPCPHFFINFNFYWCVISQIKNNNNQMILKIVFQHYLVAVYISFPYFLSNYIEKKNLEIKWWF